MASEWYYEQIGAEKGPVSGGELKKLAEEGVVMLESQVRKGANGRWVRAEMVRGLFPEKEPELTVSDPIAEAVRRFEIPPDCENFLFCLPAFYVAKSDGKISFKEVVSIIYNSLRSGLVNQRGDQQKVFNTFAQNKVREFMGRTNLEEFSILAAAIIARLDQYPDDEANRIRESIRETCTNVAKASGPLFGEKMSAEERKMLDQIFAEAL